MDGFLSGLAALGDPYLLTLLVCATLASVYLVRDVLYFFGAVAMLDGDGFSLGGTPITDWPPVFSALLASVMKIFGASVWVAKLVVLGFVAASIALSYAVARIYNLPAPRAESRARTPMCGRMPSSWAVLISSSSSR